METSVRRALEREFIGQQKRLRAFAVSLCRNSALADDLVQDTYVRAFEHIDSFEPGTNAYAWLCTILRNRFYTQKRRDWRMVEDPEGAFQKNLSVEAGQHAAIEDQEAQARSTDLLKVLRTLLRHMSDLQRNAFWLVYAEGHTYEEVAELQSCPVGTIKSRVSRVLHRLLKEVKKRDLDAEGITPDQWSAAFGALSMKVTAGSSQKKEGKRSRHDLTFCGIPFSLVETLHLGGGPATQIFRLAS